MLVSGVQQTDSVIHTYICIYTYKYVYIHIYIYIYIIFQTLSPCKLLQNTEYSSLCYTIGPCCLSILCIVVSVCYSQIPNLSLPPPFPFGNQP